MKNTAKKIVSILLTIAMTVALLSALVIPASAATYNVNAVVDYANNCVGSSYANGYCMRFVKECFNACYGVYSTSCCAYNYGSSYLDSTSSTNIPIGADIFFAGSTIKCGSCGNQCGHIGIYVGNGMVVHAWGGKIVSTTINYVVSCGYPYRGWGWHANQTYTTGSYTYSDITATSYVLTNSSAGKCLNVVGNGSASGTNVTVYEVDGTTGQTFSATKTSGGWYTLTPACGTSTRLNVEGSNSTNGANVGLYTSSGDDTQGWYFEQSGSGYVLHSADNPYYVLTAEGTSNGSNVGIAAYSAGNTAQIWTLATTDAGGSSGSSSGGSSSGETSTSVSVTGIDVSRWQNTINWASVAASGVEFAMIRVGYGSSSGSNNTIDPMFATNVAGAKAAGIDIGIYFYSYAQSAAAAANEAAWVVSQLANYPQTFTYPIAYDIEDPSQSALGSTVLTNMVLNFCGVIQNAGYYASVYANLNWFNNILNDSSISSIDHWVAQWSSSCTYSNPGMWQYTNSGSVGGISGRVDMNIAYKDYPTIMATYGLNGFSAAPVSTASPTAVTPYARDNIYEQINLIKAAYPSGSYFAADGEGYAYNGETGNKGFANYAFYSLFNAALPKTASLPADIYDTTKTVMMTDYTEGSNGGSTVYGMFTRKALPGCIIFGTTSGGASYYMLLESFDASGITVYGCNMSTSDNLVTRTTLSWDTFASRYASMIKIFRCTYDFENYTYDAISTNDPTGITLSATTATIIKGSTKALTATVSPSTATDKSVVWSSSNPSVATVSGGTVTAVSAGTATITAATSNGLTATCTVTVTVILPTSVTLSNTSLTLSIDETAFITATVLPANAEDQLVVWSTNASDVATVEPESGMITAVTAGTAIISATTTNGIKSSCTVTVSPSASGSYTIRGVVYGNYTSIATTTGSGSYEKDSSVTLTASDSTDNAYAFSRWVDINGNIISSEKAYTFTATSNLTIYAMYALKPTYYIKAVADGAHGKVIGINDLGYAAGDEATLLAKANDGYVVSYWTVNGAVVSYNDTATITVTKNTVVKVFFAEEDAVLVSSIRANISKTAYYVGDSIDLSDSTISVTYSDATTSSIAITNAMIRGFDTTSAGTKTVTVSYQGATTTFSITVAQPAISSITMLTLPTRTAYALNSTLDVTGGVIKVTYANNSTSNINLTSSMVSGFSSTTVGTKTVTVTYSGKTTTFTVNVTAEAATAQSISISGAKTVYYRNATGSTYNSFDGTTGSIITHFSNGTTTSVGLSSATSITGYNLSATGTQAITVKYNGFTTTYNITVGIHPDVVAARSAIIGGSSWSYFGTTYPSYITTSENLAKADCAAYITAINNIKDASYIWNTASAYSYYTDGVLQQMWNACRSAACVSNGLTDKISASGYVVNTAAYAYANSWFTYSAETLSAYNTAVSNAESGRNSTDVNCNNLYNAFISAAKALVPSMTDSVSTAAYAGTTVTGTYASYYYGQSSDARVQLGYIRDYVYNKYGIDWRPFYYTDKLTTDSYSFYRLVFYSMFRQLSGTDISLPSTTPMTSSNYDSNMFFLKYDGAASPISSYEVLSSYCSYEQAQPNKPLVGCLILLDGEYYTLEWYDTSSVTLYGCGSDGIIRTVTMTYSELASHDTMTIFRPYMATNYWTKYTTWNTCN